MREEITEPQHWRANNQRSDGRSASWSLRRRTQENLELAAEAIDAALTEEPSAGGNEDRNDSRGGAVSTDIISSLSSQLDMLEKQQEQLRNLLSQAQSNR